MEVVIVDNASKDASVVAIDKWISENNLADRIKLISSPVNSGFSGGNNIGIKSVKASHYLLLNSDTVVRKDAIRILLDTLSQEKTVGLVSPRLEWPDGVSQESCFKYHTPISEFIGSAKTGLITKLFTNFVVAQSVSDSPCNYSWTSFASVMIKAEVFSDIGLMDEGYFMYFEDVEFCHRAKKAGWEIMYEPSAHVVHLRGGSSPLKAQAKLRKRLPRYFYESRTRYFFQAYGRVGLLSANLLWTSGWAISSVRSMLSRSYRSDTSEKQWRDIWINFLDPLKPYIHPDNYGKKA
jgi:N-acetylglucosaminyl-diphospho-decaprenol L-rhamnosyltransferase